MKRSLHILDDSDDAPALEALFVRIGERTVSVIDTGDGLAARRFANVLVEAGGKPLDASSGPHTDTRIVIRAASKSTEARLRAAAVEEEADLVLGSARPVFARDFASACAHWVNS